MNAQNEGKTLLYKCGMSGYEVRMFWLYLSLQIYLFRSCQLLML